MNLNNKTEITSFGRLLRLWRGKKKLSQLELANLAESTPRYISFIETGRSRPGRKLILRIARAMDLPVRDVNSLMVAAALAPEYEEYEFTDEAIKPYRAAIEAILEKHDPYPACAMDALGNILSANKAFIAFSPRALAQTPEQSIDGFFDPKGLMRQFVENWEEIAYCWIDRQKTELAMSYNPKLDKLMQRAMNHLRDVKRPDETTAHVLSPRFRVGDQIISTFTTMMRFESVSEVTLSEIRVELVFPANDESRIFFENLQSLPS